jgi:beta-xylosidase
MSEVQGRYADMLIRAVVEREYIIGLSWWQLYDADDAPDVPWDFKAGFGLFDSAGKPKPAWTTWRRLCTLKKVTQTDRS